MGDLPAATRTIGVATGQTVTIAATGEKVDVLAVAVESPIGGSPDLGTTWLLVVPRKGGGPPHWINRYQVSR